MLSTIRRSHAQQGNATPGPDADFLTSQPAPNHFTTGPVVIPWLGGVSLGDRFEDLVPKGAQLVSETYSRDGANTEFIRALDVDGDGKADLRINDLRSPDGKSIYATMDLTNNGVFYELRAALGVDGPVNALSAMDHFGNAHWLADSKLQGKVWVDAFDGQPHFEQIVFGDQQRTLEDYGSDGTVDIDVTEPYTLPDNLPL